MRRFYERAMADPLLAPVFDVLAVVGLDEHLVVVGDFWEQILFRTTRYEGQFTAVHRALHGHHGLTPARFGRWLELWTDTVDTHFGGVNADRAKAKGEAIARSLERSLGGGAGSER
ncbi:group III truncated hemoglobin [Rhodococcus sp. CC-R104]|uniref:Group III truncated hemoglobin n=2 Tax=Rhodococcus chondri TaxID=3065941 RepID=A0ABU7JQZ2_9NOCA|nr:group III truncated hemoglobin [Rhodococcus sp. CC-R104]MEE2032453.1 group III truncated hemoglobin [Rhodococcus sp. CC-R104]